MPLDLHLQTPEGARTLRIDGDDLNTSVSQTLRRHGTPLNTRCGERGLCDGCLVELLQGSLHSHQRAHPVSAAGDPVTVRACDCAWPDSDQPITLRIPQRSCTAYQPQVLVDFRLNIPFAHDPIVKPPADDSIPALGAAIDIGTTTVAILLVDLHTGNVLTKVSAFNRQIDLADDVLSRINLCMTDPAMLGKLHAALVNDTLQPLFEKAFAQLQQQAAEASAGNGSSHVPTPDHLHAITFGANTTMLHLLLGIDPSPMGVVPFAPDFLEHRVVHADDLGLNLPANPVCHLLPGAAAYVGADLTAGLVATGMTYDEGPVLLVDVGTNGEILLKHNGKVTGCATAAGPAFEGVGLSDGVRAGDGAISHIDFSSKPFAVDIETIGSTKPIGLCGSAYMDVLARGAATGLLKPTARFNQSHPAAETLVDETPDCYGYCLHIANAPGRRPITVTEADLAKLLQAKAAIAAGILTLLERQNLKPADVKTLYLAGGFGMHMKTESAIGSGLLPGFTLDQIQLMGNTSLAGAYAALLDKSLLQTMTDATADIDIIELNTDPTFEDQYIDQLHLPG